MRYFKIALLLILSSLQLWAAVIPDGKAVPREAGAPELPTASQSDASKSPAPPPELTSSGKKPTPKSSDPGVSSDPSKTGSTDQKTGKSGQSQANGTSDSGSRRSDLPLANQRSLSLGTFLLIALVVMFVLGAGTLKGRNAQDD